MMSLAYAALGFAIAMQQGAVLNVTAPRLNIVEERILSSDGESFDIINSLAMGPRGDLFVYDAIQKRIVHLDENGQLIRTVARQGSGPGEYTFLIALGVVGDTLWFVDAGLRRLTLYDLSGKLIGTSNLSVTVDSRYPASIPLAFLADRSLLVRPGAGTAVSVSAPDTPLATVRTDLKGAVIDTVVVTPIGLSAFRIQTQGSTYITHPLPRVPGIVASTDGKQVLGYSFADSPTAKEERVAITFYDVASRRKTTLSAGFPAVDVTNKMKEAGIERHVASFVRAGTPVQEARAAIEKAITWPEHLAPVTGVVLGTNGFAAIRREDDGTSDITWLIAQLPGRAIGTLVLPRRDRIMGIAPGALWVARHDDDGIAALVRFRFQR